MKNPGETFTSRSELIKNYAAIRAFTEKLCEPLELEDYIIQSMPDVSPTRWHLAHTSWFFETFLLIPELPGYQTPSPLYNYLFNSYYNAIGEQYPRAKRGLLSRPTVKEIYAYRKHVDEAMIHFLEQVDEGKLRGLNLLLTLGFNHEQQHQELLLTDIKHVFFNNPMFPAYASQVGIPSQAELGTYTFSSHPGGKVRLGHEGGSFCFDNEGPRHDVLLQPFEMGNRLITNGEYLEFIQDGGYKHASLWLSDGWATLHSENWQAPLYWKEMDGQWFEFRLDGLCPLQHDTPVTHVSYYEADAFANWKAARLPSEFEWEFAAQNTTIKGNFVDSGLFHPEPLRDHSKAETQQLFGDVWEWTRSPYSPYPGFKAASGAVGEYNGKFMSSQMVLRGGSCVSSRDHLRSTYRNFFYPHSRWQFMGLRLAKDLEG